MPSDFHTIGRAAVAVSAALSPVVVAALSVAPYLGPDGHSEAVRADDGMVSFQTGPVYSGGTILFGRDLVIDYRPASSASSYAPS